MKSSYAALAAIGLALTGLWYAGGGTATHPQSAAAAEQVRVSEPLAHDNLAVFFVHGPDLVADQKVATLQEALDAGWAVVHETESVNQLSVENRSTEYELFIQEGDIIKGGKQDRMIAVDMLLPPKSGVVPFPAHCVEQGRWTGRGSEKATAFSSSNNCAVGKSIKYFNATQQQGEVWKNVAIAQDKLSQNVGVRVNAEESASSLQLALENRVVLAKIAEYEKALKAAGENGKSVVGVVFVVNGKMTGAEVYGSSVLFQKAWPKLLSSAAAEALAEKTDKPHASAPTAKEVERFLACGGEEQAAPGGTTNSDDSRIITDLVRRLGVTEAEARESLRPMSEIRDGTSNAWQPSRRMRDGVPIEQTFEYSGQSINPQDPVRRGTQTAIPIAFPDSSTSGRSAATRSGMNRSGGAQPNRLPNASPVANGEVQDLREFLQPLNRPAAQPASTMGNRLNINRVDNAAGLVTESRDPTRQNAIIHKSYIKK